MEGEYSMGGKYTVRARKHDDKIWVAYDYHSPLIIVMFKWVYCMIKYDVVTLEKHW